MLLSELTRFGVGGPVQELVDVYAEPQLLAAIEVPHVLIGGGSNLVCADEGYPGRVIRYRASKIQIDGDRVWVESGAVLQDLVDATIAAGLRGLDTMTGIPGWVGGAVYGNAGAYGHSIHERVVSVRYAEQGAIHTATNAECQFAYRESIFKQRKSRVIVAAELRLDRADAAELKASADKILAIRNEKYPPSMRCAGSIFKNLILAELPASVQSRVPAQVIREGKVPSAYFLDQVGVKGWKRGPIEVATYHANLIYNTGGGSAHQIRELIEAMKARVLESFGLELEEEVQYIGA